MPGLFHCASSYNEDPFSRSYRDNLPSSLTVIHSSALVYSTRPRVSVYGTGATSFLFSGFSWEYGYVRCWLVPEDAPYFQVRLLPWICLRQSASTPFNRLFRQTAALSLLRHHVTGCGSNGILNVSSIGLALRLSLRPRLTLIRLALIRNPWSYGEGVSRPLYRYLYLHLLFHDLQYGSRRAFGGHGMLPYRTLRFPRLR